MSDERILKTIVTQDGDETVVELHIGNGSPLDARQGTQITLVGRMGSLELPLLAHYQRHVLQNALIVLRELNDRLFKKLVNSPYPPEPRPARPTR